MYNTLDFFKYLLQPHNWHGNYHSSLGEAYNNTHTYNKRLTKHNYCISSINTLGVLLFSQLKSVPKCGINHGCATSYIHIKIIFYTSINKTIDIVTTEILITTTFLTCSNMLPIPHAGVETCESRATIRVSDI